MTSCSRNSSIRARCLPDEIIEGLRDAVRQMRIYPVLCASGLHNIGTDLLLNFILDDFPRPPIRYRGKARLTGKRSSAISRIPTRLGVRV